MTDTKSRVNRLRRRSGGWKSNITYAEDAGPPINPDGPEAAAEIERLQGALRMIVSHATGGASSDIDRSINDICVQISQHKNDVYEGGMESARRESATTIEQQAAEIERLTAALEEARVALEWVLSIPAVNQLALNHVGRCACSVCRARTVIATINGESEGE